jgi:hypothetical protein
MSIATTVSFPYRDKDGEFTVHATRYSNGVVKIERIEAEDGSDANIEDWTPNEQFAMRNLARAAAERLEDAEENEDADDEGDEDFNEQGWR